VRETNLFACLFLEAPLCEIRVLVDYKDPKLLVEEADAMWTLQRQPTVVATMPITMDLPSSTVGQVLGAQHLKSLL
jgi:hypothetical protein